MDKCHKDEYMDSLMGHMKQGFLLIPILVLVICLKVLRLLISDFSNLMLDALKHYPKSP